MAACAHGEVHQRSQSSPPDAPPLVELSAIREASHRCVRACLRSMHGNPSRAAAVEATRHSSRERRLRAQKSMYHDPESPCNSGETRELLSNFISRDLVGLFMREPLV